MGSGCPKCGFPRDGAATCRRCGVIFDRYRPLRRDASTPPADAPATPPVDVPASPSVEVDASAPGPFRRFYRVFRWVVLAACVLVVVLTLKRSPPPAVAVDGQAPQRLAAKLDAMVEATVRGEAYTLTLGEAELNAWLGQNLALASVDRAEELALPVDPGQIEEVRSNVRDLKVQLTGDLVRAYLVFDFHGRDLSLLLEGRLYAEDGYLRFVPTAALLGSLPLPKATLDRAVGRLFDDPAHRETFRLPPEIRDVRVQDGELVVYR